MEYRLLGKTGVRVSSLCFGTMSFGDTADEAESGRMFQRCREAGINFFDCANGYGGGRSEEILGRVMASERDQLVITTKVAGKVGNDLNQRGASRRHIQQQIESSLKRLNTDRVEVYFIHFFDSDTAIEETLRALDGLVQQGKILYPAVSNWAAWQISKALGMCAYEGLARIEVIQPMYNLVKRQAEVEILPMAQAEQVAVIPYSPLGGGLLTGKYATGEAVKQGRLIENPMYTTRYGVDMYHQIATNFSNFARERGYDPAALAVAWVMAHPAVTAPIIGARSVAQLESSLAAAEITMTQELYTEIAALSYSPPPAHDRLEEQKPVTSR
jgi:aryl-alcohol dehydrogenase-like predicted oxidoreductase